MIVHTLHLHPHNKDHYYGIAHNGLTFRVHVFSLTMYQEIKPREIWVNEYPSGFRNSAVHVSKVSAELDSGGSCLRQIKFREVLDDEQ